MPNMPGYNQKHCDEVWKAGFIAAKEGKLSTDNPYLEDVEPFDMDNWASGWASWTNWGK